MYECLNDFKSQKINKNYKYGDVISEAEYYTLESFERLKFRKDVRHYSEESFHSKNSDIIQSPSFFDNSLNWSRKPTHRILAWVGGMRPTNRF